MEFYQKIIILFVVTWMYAFTFAFQIKLFFKKLQTNQNKFWVMQWGILSALFGLTLYVYMACLLLFR